MLTFADFDKNMRQLFFLLGLLLFAGGADAQQSPMAGGGTGRIYGKVIDAQSNKPVDYATVLLLGNDPAQPGKKMLVKGTQTAPNGEFSLDDVAPRPGMVLTITAIGYKNYETKLQGGNPFRDMGNIRLEAENTQLQGVVVTATTPQIQLQGEKKIFNVSQSLTAQGGTAQDVMKDVPGVQVDAQGNVSIRNSAPQILVDGRESPLTLDQIPAEVIDRIEVITNPSSRYDAEGGAGGVLNVVLKKERKQGYNGNVRLGGDTQGGAFAGGDANVRSGKVNVFAGLNAHFGNRPSEGYTERTDLSGSFPVYTYQDDESKRRGFWGFGRLGLDYFVTNRTTLSLSGTRMMGRQRPEETIDIRTDSLTTPLVQSFSQRRSDSRYNMDRWGAQLGMKHLFPKEGMVWTADVTYNAGENVSRNIYSTNFYNNPDHSDWLGGSGQKTEGSGSSGYLTVQSDFTLPFTGTQKLDVGVKLTSRSTQSDIDNFVRNGAGDFVLVPNDYSNYSNTDNVYAAYGSFSGNINKNLGYQVGLRAESYVYRGKLENTGQTFENNYPIGLFPSVSVSQQLPHNQQLQLSYRRGVRRPNFWNLMPYTDYSDPLNIRQGNPGLKPEFSHTGELNYTRDFGKGNYFLASFYGKYSDDLIAMYQMPATDPFTGQPAIINTYINANSSLRLGLELTGQWQLLKWWTAMGNLNLYNSTIKTGNAQDEDNSYFSWFGKLNNTFKVYKNLTLQVNGYYQSRSNTLADAGGGPHWGSGMGSSSTQGYLEATWSADAALRYQFLKNNAAALLLSWNDIFNSRSFLAHTESPYFIQNTEYFAPQGLRLTFSYRFGKTDRELFRRKPQGTTDDDSGGGMGGF